MKYIIIILLVLLSSVGLIYNFPQIFDAIVATFIPLIFVNLINSQRMNAYSSGKIGMWNAFKGNSISLLFSIVLPARVSELIKPVYFKSKLKIPYSMGVSVVFLERFFDIVALFLISLAVLFFLPLPEGGYQSLRWFLITSSIFVFAIFILFLCLPFELEKLDKKLPNFIYKSYILSALSHIKNNFKSGLSIYQVLLVTCAWSGSMFVYWVYFQFDNTMVLDTTQIIIVFIVATLGLSISVTPGGVGSFEAIVSSLLVSFGYELDDALISVLGLRVALFLPVFFVTLLVTIFEGPSFFRLLMQSINLRKR
ncbi:lysylphosphatidylglycerol synthase transmembrane domain-containing protein [Vibrio sp. HN007]|uniref:lysylphosphatidylglycerol synthase transmembrane domain-containing protein n=1 Tax=Vibrio iocasae TaxID=3098914 RepID=UPI0035D4EB65